MLFICICLFLCAAHGTADSVSDRCIADGSHVRCRDPYMHDKEVREKAVEDARIEAMKEVERHKEAMRTLQASQPGQKLLRRYLALPEGWRSYASHMFLMYEGDVPRQLGRIDTAVAWEDVDLIKKFEEGLARAEAALRKPVGFSA